MTSRRNKKIHAEILGRLSASNSQVFAYLLERAGLDACAPIVPCCTYGEYKNLDHDYRPGQPLVPQDILQRIEFSYGHRHPLRKKLESPGYPVLMRGSQPYLDYVYGNHKQFLGAKLKRYFRMKKFTALNYDVWKTEFDRLKELWPDTDVYHWDLRHVAEDVAVKHGYIWVRGEYGRADELLPGYVLETDQEKEIERLRARVSVLLMERSDMMADLRATKSTLSKARAALAEGRLDVFCDHVLSQPGQYFDDVLPQLCLRVDRAGRRSWWVNAAQPKKRAAYKKVGNFGCMSLEEARVEARKRLAGDEYRRVPENRPAARLHTTRADERAILRAIYDLGLIKEGDEL